LRAPSDKDTPLARCTRSTEADPYRWLGRIPEALEAYGKALEMSQLEPEKRLLQWRIQESRNNFYQVSIWARPKRL